jgi:hypothetical protein
MYVEIETEAALFPEKEYINGIFVAVWFAKGRRGSNDILKPDFQANTGLCFFKSDVTTRNRKEVARKSRYSFIKGAQA